MKTETPELTRKPTLLKDYRPPAWLVPEIKLTFELDPERTRVKSELSLRRNPAAKELEPPKLNGERMEFLGARVNGRELAAGEYELSDTELIIKNPPADEFILEVENVIAPVKNTALEGLYMSGGAYCTQNEPQGFRRITYFPDRPDVMSKYRTTIIADKASFPMLLSNGNPVERKDLDDGRHQVTWEDPFAKPAYLFALVGGDLGVVRDIFKTASGREVKLEIYTDKGAEERCEFAMESLKQAMRWDEETFGLEYDLDIYMIVAVEDFNFGAMENKGLNIFNSKLVLAEAATATDEAFERIQGVIGHEYFHNWTGNRVTCRDWFQLTLKEGLTVYRDQRFTADMTAQSVKRIKDVTDLREYQFPEDGGPMAHPIQPKSFLEINNFYTMTVYEKGAEVIGMIATLIGKDAFRRGVDRYFELYDGQAVTTGDFVDAMQEASGFDLSVFRRWYDQSGTPVLKVFEKYDPDKKTLELRLEQGRETAAPCDTETDSASDEVLPLLIPVRVGLLNAQGQDLPLTLEGHNYRAEVDRPDSLLIAFADFSSTYLFLDVPEKPTLSLLRDFSAPVKLEIERGRDELGFLMAHDSDHFNRWEAGHRLSREVIFEILEGFRGGATPVVPEVYLRAMGALIVSDQDPAFLALALTPPSESNLTGEMDISDFEGIHQAREFLIRGVAARFREELLELYHRLHGQTNPDKRIEVGNRKLKNRALSYLMRLGDNEIESLCAGQRRAATNMTDELSALALLVDGDSNYRADALNEFYEKWKSNSLVMDSWFASQASSSRKDTLEVVKKIATDPLFNKKNPNKVRSLFGAFARNGLRFNAPDGAGYEFIADCIIELDAINPGVASGLSRAFTRLGKLAPELKAQAQAQLERVIEHKPLSNDVYEIVDRCLKF